MSSSRARRAIPSFISATGSRARVRCATRTASSRRSASPPRAGCALTCISRKPEIRSQRQFAERAEFWFPVSEPRAETIRLGEAFRRQAPSLGALAPPIPELGHGERAACGGGIGQPVLLAEDF